MTAGRDLRRGRVDQERLRVYAPVTGTVVARNDALDASPELVNSDPYGDGWMLDDPAGRRGPAPTGCSTPRPTRPAWQLTTA